MGPVNPRLDRATWPEIADYLTKSTGIIVPVGSTEQHGPMGLIGTDALCAEAIANRAAALAGAFVAPTLAYTPAPFNTGFPGTISLSEPVFQSLFAEVIAGLTAQGFDRVYVLNAHGANLAPMRALNLDIRIRSWWDFPTVNVLRQELYGAWEGMHATPSEIAITQVLHRTIPPGDAQDPPRQLPADEIRRRAGDNHGPPDLHKSEFPDGRVGSHSALARPEHGARLLRAAAQAVAQDFTAYASAR